MALEQWRLADVGPFAKIRQHVLLVAHRNRTWVEWVVFSACLLNRRGHRVTILYSPRELTAIYSNERITEKFWFSFWDGVRTLPGIELLELDRFATSAASEAAYDQMARSYAPSVAAYDLGFEEHSDSPEYATAVQAAIPMLCHHGAAAQAALEQARPNRCICPSGMVGWSSAFREAAARLRVPSAFVEAWSVRPGHMIWGINRSPFDVDVQGWMATIGGWDESKERDAQAFAAFQERATVNPGGWLVDFQPLQKTPRSLALPETITKFLARSGPVVLMGTNVVGDSATLRRASLFKHQRHWVESTVDFFRARPALNLLIRAHPDEARARARVRIADFAKAAAAGCENILIVDGTDSVSTYALVGHAHIGLAWVSNIGVDMVLRGKPVVVAADAQYAKVGVGIVPRSITEYFEAIEQQIAHTMLPSSAMAERAKLYQHILFKRMSLRAATDGYESTDYRLDPPGGDPERETFYRILTGELNAFGEPIESNNGNQAPSTAGVIAKHCNHS